MALVLLSFVDAAQLKNIEQVSAIDDPAEAVMVCFRGEILSALTSFTAGNYIYSLAVAAVFIVLVFILRKYVEMVGTAMLGGFGIACVVRGFYDYTSLQPFVGIEWLGVLVVTLIFALVGFIVQIRTRSRY